MYWNMRQADLQQQQRQPPLPQAPPLLPLIDRLRQRQEQEEQRLHAQTDTASALSDTEAAQSRHDSMQTHTPRTPEQQASPQQQASQLPSASGQPHDRQAPDPSGDRFGSAASAAAVLDAALAETEPTKAQQLGRAGSLMTGSRPQSSLPPAVTDSTDIVAGVSAQATQAAKPPSSLHGPGAALSVGGWTSEQRTQSAAAPAGVPEGQSAAAALPERQVAAADSEPVAAGQSEAEPMPEMLQSRRAMLQQQQQGEAVMSEQLGGLLQQGEPASDHQASAQLPQTDAAAAAGVPDPPAVGQMHQTVMPQPQLAVVPEQAVALVLQQHEAAGGQNLAPVPQQHEAEGGQNPAVVPQQHEAAGVVLNDDHPMAFEELVGLRGPIRLLFENAGTVIVTSAMFVGAALWAPFMWGSLTIKGIVMAQASWKLTVLPAAAMQLLLKTHQISADPQSMSSPGSNSSADSSTPSPGMELQQALVGIADTADNVTAHAISLEHLAHDLQQHLAGLAAVMGKVMLVLVMELAILPVAYGFWLDVCALPLFEGSLPQRLALLRSAPLTWTMLHWMLGMACLMVTATFLSVVRSVLRPGALPWLKDPFDPEGEPLQQVLSSSMLLQLGRAAGSLATMSCLAVLLVHLPIKLARVLVPSLFPFAFHHLDTITEVPADMLLLHVCLPFTLPHLHIRQWSKTALSWWLRAVGQLWGVDHYLLPPRAPQQPPQPPPQPQQQLPVLAALADSTSTPSPPLPTAEGSKLPRPSSIDKPVPAAEGEVKHAQHASAIAPPSDGDSQGVSKTAAGGHCMHGQGLANTSSEEDSGDSIAGLSGTRVSGSSLPSSSTQPQAMQAYAAASRADVASDMAEGSWLGTSTTLEAPSDTSGTHGRRSNHRLVADGDRLAEDSEQGAEPRGVTSIQQHGQSDGAMSVYSQGQAGAHAESLAQPTAQGSGPSTQTGEHAEAEGQGDVPRDARKLSIGLSQTHSAGAQSGAVAPEAGHMPSAAAQTAPVDAVHEAWVMAEGLIANMQLEGGEGGAPTQLMIVGVLLMLTLLIFMTGVLTLPCVIGRGLLRSMHAPLRHDLYCAVMGAYAIWGSAAAAHCLLGLAQRTTSGSAMLRELWGWLLTLVRLTLLAVLTLIVIPFMAGLYLDLVMLPFRVRASESPVIFIYQDWACGVLLTKIGYKIVTSEGNLPQPLALVRERVQLVRRFGVLRVPFMLAFRELLLPIMKPMMVLLAVPYAITRGVVPFLDLSAEQMQTLNIWGFAVEHVVVLAYFCLRQLHSTLQRLHNSIRDDRYLVGRQLNNFLSSHI
ncbi:hypothetical protein ABBQ38_007973 [Trebouxia sp. C0009 RCD-2024]